jgi:rubrerythrin
MSMTLKDRLTLALLDEYKSRATYAKILEKFGPVRPFINIHEAEGRHVEALLRLFESYQIEVPVDHWPCHITVPPTLKEACQQAVEAEQDNMTMYDRILAETSEPDVRRVLQNLQSASRDRHLPAFERCVHRES